MIIGKVFRITTEICGKQKVIKRKRYYEPRITKNLYVFF